MSEVVQIGEEFTEETKTGRVIMSPIREDDIVSVLFTKIFVNDYDKLCDADVLG